MNTTKKSKVKRAPKRGAYDEQSIYQVLDKEYLCHVGIVHEGVPVVIPTMFGREGNVLYLHGASVSRLMKELEKGENMCLSVANVSGLVLARSAFHHSLNYESVVVFGKGKRVEEERKEHALKVISDHLIPGRWEEVRPPSVNELKATSVIEVTIEEASAKVRKGPVADDKADYELSIWAGLVPVSKAYAQQISDAQLSEGIKTSNSVIQLIKNQ
jgi:nitroimidazol reductase NimA-like FMN-containing flavoprotein (pyridoxamine 5'-phosphate oxidase superfamily)